MKFDLRGMLRINRGNRTFWFCFIYTAAVGIKCLRYRSWMLQNLLILSCQHFDSKHNWSLLCILSHTIYIIYDWITIMGYSKRELSTINVLHSLKHLSYNTPTPPSPLIMGSLRTGMFNQRTSTSSKAFSFLICLDNKKFVFLSLLTLIGTIWLKIWAKPSLKNEKGWLLVDVCHWKTLLLKLPNGHLSTMPMTRVAVVERFNCIR